MTKRMRLCHLCLSTLSLVVATTPRPFADGSPAVPSPILEYRFNETGTTAPSTGLDPTFVALKDTNGDAADLHGSPSSGVSGLVNDLAFDNSHPVPFNGEGTVGEAGYGGRAEQPTDDNNVDGLASFTF